MDNQQIEAMKRNITQAAKTYGQNIVTRWIAESNETDSETIRKFKEEETKTEKAIKQQIKLLQKLQS